MTTMSSISPHDLGLPPAFSHWRHGQWQAIETGLSTPHRFVVHNAPTGFGKSVVCMAHAILSGERSIYCTSTKGLQDQLANEGYNDLADLRGRQNYHCIQGSDTTCAEGRLLGCQDENCPYLTTRNNFIGSDLCLTNYSCYFASVLHGDGMDGAPPSPNGQPPNRFRPAGRKCGLLILDEAHNIIEELSSALEISLNHHANQRIYKNLSISTPPYRKPLPAWKAWASGCQLEVKAEVAKLKEKRVITPLVIADKFLKDLNRIVTLQGDWIVDETTTPGTTLFAPLWPTDYMEKVLYRGIKTVMAVSATVVPKTITLLGMPADQVLFVDHPPVFSPSRCPVYLIGSWQINHRTDEGSLAEQLARMDLLISRRLDRKGLIHPVSYRRQQTILENSRYADLMIAPKPGPGNLERALREFREAEAPCILISPAITTGYDFPGAQAEYQILMKVPFIDARSPVMKARAEADPEYLPYITAQTLVQTCGRIMRSEKDQGESFILDANANWFLGTQRRPGKMAHLFPKWFMRQVVRVWEGDGPPAPPKALAA